MTKLGLNTPFGSLQPFSPFGAAAVSGAMDALTAGSIGKWSVARRVLTSYNSTLITVRRDNDDELAIAASNWILDTAALLGFAGTGNAWVKTVHPQLGAVSFGQSDNAKQPRIVIDGILVTQGGLPAMFFDHTAEQHLVASAAMNVGCFSIVARLDQSGLNYQGLITGGTGDGGDHILRGDVSGAGISASPLADDVYHIDGVHEADDAPFAYDYGRHVYSIAGSSPISSTYRIGSECDIVNRFWSGYIQEWVFATDATNRVAVDAKMRSYYLPPFALDLPAVSVREDLATESDTQHISSAAKPFSTAPSSMVIVAGTNWTPGQYAVDGIASGIVDLASAAATQAATGGDGYPWYRQLLMIGDSLIEGIVDNPGFYTMMPDFLSYEWDIVNLGTGGWTTENNLSANNTRIGIYKVAPYNRQAVVIQCGTNDFWADFEVADAYNRLVAICSAWRLACLPVFVQTVPPRTSVGAPVGFNAKRLAYNALIRSTPTTVINGVIEIANDPRLDDSDDAAIYVDKTHWTPAGALIVAELTADTVSTFFSEL